jgi:hypothetical protein
MCRENLFLAAMRRSGKAIRPACAVCIAILVQACNLLAIERLSVEPNRPHVILAGDRPIFLAGYYEAPDRACHLLSRVSVAAEEAAVSPDFGALVAVISQ